MCSGVAIEWTPVLVEDFWLCRWLYRSYCFSMEVFDLPVYQMSAKPG